MRPWRPKVSTGYPDAYVRRILYNDMVSGWRRRRLEIVTDTPPDLEGIDLGDTWHRTGQVISCTDWLHGQYETMFDDFMLWVTDDGELRQLDEAVPTDGG